MRVKKLNVNRRHKPGEDEAAIGVAVDGDSEQHKWVSPVKPRREGPVASSSSGNSSPTDVQQQQQQLVNEHSPLQFQVTNDSELFIDRGPVMSNAATDSDTHEEESTIHEHAIRSVMVGRIKEMLQAMKPHAPEKVLAALPRLAQHMEKSLFKQAKNEAEYCDPTTLRLRIARIQENNAKRLLAQRQQPPEQNHNGKEAMLTLRPVTEEQARLIFQYLQSWRQQLVNTYGVAPWDILPNSTLAKVALYMPLTEQELVVCGVGKDKLAQFGPSLLRDLSKAANKAKATQSRKPSHGKRSSPGSLAGGNRNKKRKDGEAARLGSAAPSSSGSLLKSPAPLLPAVDSLPTLLPTVSMMPGGGTASSTATSSSMAMKQSHFSSAARLSPAQASQEPFFTRVQPQQQQGSSSPAQENHMHLLVQGAGQLSKQQNAKSLEAYEQEVQSLRWMLHQSQQESTRLEQEVEHLRSELRGRHRTK